MYDGAAMGIDFPVVEEPSFLDKVQVCCVPALHVVCDDFEFPEVSFGAVWLVKPSSAIEVVGSDLKVLNSRHVKESLRLSPVRLLEVGKTKFAFSNLWGYRSHN